MVDNFQIGDPVYWNSNSGKVSFVGETKFAPGIWIGITLDQSVGEHNGTYFGVKYFEYELLTENENLDDQIESLEELIKKLQEEKKEMNEKNNNLEEKMNSSEKEKVFLANLKLRDEIFSLQNQFDEMEYSLQEKQKEENIVVTEIEEVTDSLQSRNKTILNQKIDEMNKEIAELTFNFNNKKKLEKKLKNAQ
ncbi:cap-gly domain-containing linker protein [Anaeramoeba ignava]|uniref:Cap-gly domain-containing linker protein n=1 Tax=Anaeramoeba ignava TaxID=1746090 RepID=A0A9Q0LWG9_ANAIG|nr:cap-gly domain-containing linker protein [Anaeramoeba ignava]